MTTQQNKAALRHIHEIKSNGNFEKLDEVIATNYVDHSAPAGTPAGIAGVKQIWTVGRTAFPDFKIKAEDMIAEGDKVVARVTMHGTHKGEFQGIAPTGKEVTMNMIEITRFVDGKLVERWEQTDNMGMMHQLNSMPNKG